MLNPEPLLQTSAAIQFHVVTAVVAALTGLFILLTAKGSSRHRWLGRVFALAMVSTALSSFLIHELRTIGVFSAIHLLSIYVLFSIVRSIRAIRRGQVRTHQVAMLSTYVAGIIVAGGFAFLPGRLMARITYGGTQGEFPTLWLFSAIAGVGLLTGVYVLCRSVGLIRTRPGP